MSNLSQVTGNVLLENVHFKLFLLVCGIFPLSRAQNHVSLNDRAIPTQSPLRSLAWIGRLKCLPVCQQKSVLQERVKNAYRCPPSIHTPPFLIKLSATFCQALFHENPRSGGSQAPALPSNSLNAYRFQEKRRAKKFRRRIIAELGAIAQIASMML